MKERKEVGEGGRGGGGGLGAMKVVHPGAPRVEGDLIALVRRQS